MASLRLTVSAQADLEAIQRDGLNAFGPDVALAHMAGFERLFALLRDHPLAGQARPDFGQDIRQLVHRPHRILYRVTGESVLIVRILHSAMDTRARLDQNA